MYPPLEEFKGFLGSYSMAAMLWQLCVARYAVMLWQLFYGRFCWGRTVAQILQVKNN